MTGYHGCSRAQFDLAAIAELLLDGCGYEERKAV